MPSGIYKRTKPAWNRGRKMSDEEREKNRSSHLGIKPSLETRKKMSESHKKAGSGKWMKGRALPEHTKQKISLALSGKPKPWRKGARASEETRNKMRAAHTGIKNHFFGKKHTEETRKKLSEKRIGMNGFWKGRKRPQFSDVWKKNMGLSRLGEKNTNWKGGENRFPKCEVCNKILSRIDARFCSEHKKILKGELSRFWMGGITPINQKIRTSREYRLWRDAVFKRDDYRCLDCGVRNGEQGVTGTILHADHIFPFALFPRLRLDVNNGRTLCIDCHRQTDTYGAKGLKRIKQFAFSITTIRQPSP